MQNLYCPKCGQNLNGNTDLKFCPKCGAKIQTNISGNGKKRDDIDKLMNSDFIQMVKRDYFSYTGRLNRKIYFIRSLVLVVLECILFVLIDELDTRSDDFSLILMLLSFILLCLCIVADFMLDMRRFHDLDKSGYFALLSLIPAITPFLYLYLFLMPGTKGANQYGNDPLENTY